MSESYFELIPEKKSYRTEESISIKDSTPELNTPALVEAVDPHYNGLSFEVNEGEIFYFSMPGEYALSREGQRVEVQVAKQHYLDFGSEFGFFFVGAFSIVMAVFIWTLRKKSSGDGSV